MEKEKIIENLVSLIGYSNNSLMISTINPYFSSSYALMNVNAELIKLKNAIENEKEISPSTFTDNVPLIDCFNMKKDSRYLEYIRKEKKEKVNESRIDDLMVLSVDIRKSTYYLENCDDPKNFEKLINEINKAILQCIKEYNGIPDKFTGDGFLIYFTEDYSENDYCVHGLLCAQEIINKLIIVFERNEPNFLKFPFETGVGIGVDIGNVGLIKINNDATCLGNCIVNACRICSSSNNNILVNSFAYHKIKRKHPYFILNSSRIPSDYKNSVEIAVYNVIIDEKYNYSKPKWDIEKTRNGA
jgi:class 3 adenylate cyclase